MQSAVYGIISIVLFIKIQNGSSEISADTPKEHPHKEESDPPPLKGTIKWPFSKEDFKDPIQSPVDLITTSKNVKKINGYFYFWKRVKDLKIIEPHITDTLANVFNTGETVYVYIKEQERTKLPHLEGGPLKGRFIFEQMHFHWGRQNIWGSEHFIDGEAFAVEMHLVHYNGKYSNFKEALDEEDGIAVLTIFGKVAKDSNNLLEPLDKILNNIKEPKTITQLNWKEAMQWPISGMQANNVYYTYPGSLTTYPYSQNVAFIILPKPITLSDGQLNAFRSLHHDEKGDPIMENKRSLQPLNHRPILKGKVKVKA